VYCYCRLTVLGPPPRSFNSYWNFLLYAVSGQDSTVRIWNMGSGSSKSQPFLQQTCVFNNGTDFSGRELEGKLIDYVVWNCTGKLVAGSIDNMITIWSVSGEWHTSVVIYHLVYMADAVCFMLFGYFLFGTVL